MVSVLKHTAQQLLQAAAFSTGYSSTWNEPDSQEDLIADSESVISPTSQYSYQRLQQTRCSQAHESIKVSMLTHSTLSIHPVNPEDPCSWYCPNRWSVSKLQVERNVFCIQVHNASMLKHISTTWCMILQTCRKGSNDLISSMQP
jgi:hypothetical protein